MRGRGWGPGDDITRYDWDFGDGEVAADGGPIQSHTFVQPETTFTVRLTVTDNETPPATQTDDDVATVTTLARDDPLCEPEV